MPFDFNSSLYSAFPEMRAIVKDKVDYFGDEEPGSYLVFEQILVPAIQDAGTIDPIRLKELMDFVESVARVDSNMVGICLGEVIQTLPNAQQVREAAGPITKRAIC